LRSIEMVVQWTLPAKQSVGLSLFVTQCQHFWRLQECCRHITKHIRSIPPLLIVLTAKAIHPDQHVKRKILVVPCNLGGGAKNHCHQLYHRRELSILVQHGLQNRTEQLRKLGRFITTTQTSLTIWSLYTPPAWVQNSVAVGTAERGLSPSRMSFLGIGQPTPGGAEHMHLMICTLTMPFPFRPFLVRCAVPNPVLGLGGGMPPLPPV
jgi:hypothetical protein